MTTPRKRVLSGMQPSGLMHLGNQLGALENWKALQQSYDCYFFVADWHALSTNYADTSRVREFVHEMLIDWLAAGIDPDRSTVFVQSRIPEHAILHLLLSMMTPVSWLERNPTYKEKQEEIKEKDLGTYGFLGYPVLQAADILLYKPDFVPVGKDQLPHLELTREIARVGAAVGKEGRTVIFVSHSMPTVTSLCDRAILLESGRVAKMGPTSEVVMHYYTSGQASPASADFSAKHTGDSIVVAPSQTMTNREYHNIRSISIRAIRALGIVPSSGEW